jgi:hypothetical protein
MRGVFVDPQVGTVHTHDDRPIVLVFGYVWGLVVVGMILWTFGT